MRRAISVTTAPGARLSATIARFCSALHRRRRSGPVMTSNLAIAPSLAPVQTLLLAPVPTSPTRLPYARRPSPDGYGPLLDQIDDPIASMTGDGAYDQDGVYGEVAARHPDAAVIVPPRSNAVPSETAENAPTPRDRHLQAIAEHGRMGWQKASGYNWRARVEADIGRWKRVIGHALRSQTDERQAAEVAIAIDVLNRMLELGRPSYVRIA